MEEKREKLQKMYEVNLAKFQQSTQPSVGEAIADLIHIPINTQTDNRELNQKGEYAQYLDKIFPHSAKSSNTISGCLATAHTPATQQKYGDTIPGEKEPTTWAKRLSSDGFSPTLRAGSGNRTAARPIHYEHARVITVREAARLHSFPDWFDFGTSKLAAHKAIGNSVPPLLAYAIAYQVWTHLEENISCITEEERHITNADFSVCKHSPIVNIISSFQYQLGRENLKIWYRWKYPFPIFSGITLQTCNRAPPKS